MGLKENLSRLSPNEFLEKMQDMFQMYQESQDDYYEEGIKDIRKKYRQSNVNSKSLIDGFKRDSAVISRFFEKIFAANNNVGKDDTIDTFLILEKMKIHSEMLEVDITLEDLLWIMRDFANLAAKTHIADQLKNREYLVNERKRK